MGHAIEHFSFSVKDDKKRITDFIKREDIDIENKVENMYESEISEEIYVKIIESPVLMGKIEENIWNKLNDEKNPYSRAKEFEDLSPYYETDDERKHWSACLYNHDLLYMQAIAEELDLPVPKETGYGMLFLANETK